jgi:pimeloyl-ACP methyl ester carboxylesterase
MAVFQHSGAVLHFETIGERGPVLLLVPGLASDAASWGPLPALLARERRVILLDNRGAGRTRSQGPLSLAIMAADALALLDHLGHARASVLGHSMGGAVALALAAAAPERIESLALAASFLQVSARNRVLFQDWATALESSGEPAAWYRNLFAWIFSAAFFDSPQDLEAATRAAVAYPFAPSPAQFRSQVEALAAYRAPAGLAALATPALVLAGGQDILVPPAACRQLADALPHARYQEIPGAAHALHLEQSGLFAQALGGFLPA